MGAGWIAQGPDTPAPAGTDPWTPVGPDTPSVPALVRPHQDPNAHPVDNSRGLFTRGKDLLFGHEPEGAEDADQAHVAGILPAVGAAVHGYTDDPTRGPDVSTLAAAYPHLVGAQFGKLKAGYQESHGAAQVQNAERQLAGLNVLPQVAARLQKRPGDIVPVEALAKDPLVDKTARSLGLSPQEFAGDWGQQYQGLTPEQQADSAARAQDVLQKGQANETAGRATRNQAWADERVWRPSDLKNGALDPWSLKGVAFNAALAIPQLAAVTGATVGAGALGGPGAGIAAGAGTAAALFAPAQRADAKDKIDDQVNRLLEKADDLDRVAPVGGKRGLNPVTEQIRQQAADLAASSDKIADTAGFLYAVADAAGAVPVASVLNRTPVGKAVLDRIVGAGLSKTVGGRIAGTMVANGAGGMLQASLQKAVDAGIVHEQTTLGDALKDIAYTGVTSAVTAAPIAAAHEAAGAPARARARRDLESDELLNRVKTASAAMGQAQEQAEGTYPGYRWNDATGKYEPTETNAAANATKPRISGTTAPPGATKGPEPETQGPSGAPGAAGARQAFQSKMDALNTAAAAAEKRADVTLEPEEEGWSVHVKGEPIAKFDTVDAAREAVAQARKVVGTKPAAASSAPSPEAAKGEDELERTQPIQPERRTATELRQRVASMTPEQMKAALLQDDKTPLLSRRGWEEREARPTTVHMDLDSLKALNDKASYDTGDLILKAAGKAISEEFGQDHASRVGGDEFKGDHESPEAAHAAMERVNQRLSGTQIEVTLPDGRKVNINGIGLSYGVGASDHEAETALHTHKVAREGAGTRSPRGELPQGTTITAAEAGRPGDQGYSATEEKNLNRSSSVSGISTAGIKPGSTHLPVDSGDSTVHLFGDSATRKSIQEKGFHSLPIESRRMVLQSMVRAFHDPKILKSVVQFIPVDMVHLLTPAQDDSGGRLDNRAMLLHALTSASHGPIPRSVGRIIEAMAVAGRAEKGASTGVVTEGSTGGRDFTGVALHGRAASGTIDDDGHGAGSLKASVAKGGAAETASSVPNIPKRTTQGPSAKHDSILQFLARHARGLDREEAKAQGIDPADMALSAAHVGIKRAFRTGGLSFDHAAEALHEAGYPVADRQGHYSPNVLLDRIDDELRGEKHYSTRNESAFQAPEADWRRPLTQRELDNLSIAATHERIKALQAEQERLERELERGGLSDEAETDEDLERIPFTKGKAPGTQQDLFGAVDHVKNEIKRAEAALDKKRSSGQESVETGRPDDLFSQARQQTDLTDVAKPPAAGALEDAGEKIGGARKDKWAERGMRLADLSAMTEGEAATLVNKKAVWNPDWPKIVAAGTPKDVAALGKVIFDQLAAKPRFNTPDGRRQYVETLGRVRDMILEAKDESGVRGVQAKLVAELGMPTGYSIASTPEQRLARDKFWSIQKGRRSTLHVAHSDIRKAEALIAAGWPAKKVKDTAETGEVKDKGPPEPKRPHLDEINRIGPPVRTGDVTSTDFVKDLGFRGLEFGNWAASDERQRLLNHAYEGLQDLARILDLPPKALSLNGTMGLALGARGGGRFAAHYEPGKLVINMTKINGAGALAHEWAHALDHYMGELGRPDAYTTGARGASGWYDDRRSLGHLRPEMQDAWNGVMEALYKRNIGAAETIRDGELSLERATADRQKAVEAMVERPNDTNLRARLNWIDERMARVRQVIAEARADPQGLFGTRPTEYVRHAGRLGEYWRRPTEMWARAFEGYVQDKIKAEGGQSDYLVQGAEGERYATGYKGNPYPLEDRPAINAAIQKLVDTLETRTEGGKEVLFRRGAGTPTKSIPAEVVRAVVDRMVSGFAVKPDVTVVDTASDLAAHPEVGDIVKAAGPGYVPIAFVHPRTNKIYLIADQITSTEHAASTFVHEYLTHFGLRAAFGSRRDPAYQAILDGVAKAMPAALREQGDREFPDGFNPLNRRQRSVAAEEVLAYYGQDYASRQDVPARAKRWFDRLYGMIRDWLRKVWGLPKKFDETFVKRTLADLESFLRRGKSQNTAGGTEAEPAFAGRQDTFFSGLAKAVDAAKREKGTGAEWEATLRNMPGVKAEELSWTGLKDWLQDRGRVTKAEVADYVHAHRVQLGERVYGMGSTDESHMAKIRSWLVGNGEDMTEDDVGDMRRTLVDASHGDAFAIGHLESQGVPAFLLAPFYDTTRHAGGETQGAPKFGQYVAPGGENYRELLMTLASPRPEALEGRKAVFDKWAAQIKEADTLARDYSLSSNERASANWKAQELRVHRDDEADQVQPLPAPYKGPHWDESNVLAHVRFDERTGAGGERVLHIAELQSDWHLAGRKAGYLIAKLTQEDAKRLFGIDDDVWESLDDAQREAYREEMETGIRNNERYITSGMVPDAPFKTTWPDLSMKRMLRYAAEHGYDALSWDTGDTNAERYDLSKQINSVAAVKHVRGDGTRDYTVKVTGKNGEVLHDGGFQEDRLEGFIGKELAQKIIDQPPGLPAVKYEGLDLKVGGEGMKAFYDKMLPATVGKLVKKWGGVVEPSVVNGEPTSEDESGTETAFPVHMVAITPAMRDSVMGGQPMFLKRRKGSKGEEPSKPKRGAYDLARRAVAAIPQSELNLSLRRIIDPAGVSEVASSTALRFRESLGELAQAREEAVQHLEQFAKQFDLLNTQDRYDFIDDMETGSPQRNKELQPAADAIRKLLDDWREKIRGLGVGALDNFIENYFPHIWQNDNDAKKWISKVFGRRPLKGPASFLKERTIPTTKEGLEAGLQPISTNPLILAFAKLAEMMKFHAGVKFVQALKDEKLTVFKPSFKPMPEGWVKIEDAVGRVLQWSEAEQGFIERGHYIMPADGGRIVNNHLGGSALRNFLPAQLFRVVSNAANALQLGFSAFHLGFTTLDAIISKNALAIERLAHGEPLRAAAALLEAGLAGAPANLVRGYRLRKAYGNPDAASPTMQRIVQGLMASGGKIKMDRYFMAAQGISPFHGVGMTTLARDVKAALTQPSGKVAEATKVLASFPLQYATKMWRDLEAMAHELQWPWLTLPIEVAGRLTRASTSVIMEHIVPLQKLGVFSDLASDHIRRNPGEDPVAFAGAMQRIWDSVDNRLGEMVYDNLFWNRTFKDVSHMAVRAVGWNLGTVRELGGAPIDVVKLLDYMARGAPAEDTTPSLGGTAKARADYEAQKSRLQRIAEKVGHKIPYTLALVGTTMLAGAILQYMLTGKGPEEVKDYFFPWTGRMTKYGTKERISLPSYMKDIYEYSTQPATTVINKANPIFGIIHAIYANEDFFGNPVRDPDAGFIRQMIQGAQYAAHEVMPFSIQGGKQFAGAGQMDAKGKFLTVAPYVGLTPAPARVTSPEQMERYQLRETEKGYIRGLQYRLKKALESHDAAEVNRLRDEIREHKVKEKSTERDIRTDKIKAREAADKISSLIEGRSRSDAAAALNEAGYPAFAELWRSLPESPRPRVAQSLESFA